MRILDLEATRYALPFDKLIAAIEGGFRGPYEAPLRHHHHCENKGKEADVLLLMPAWRETGFGGIKLVNVVPRNARRGKPAISSSYVLFDRDTGEHLLVLDGGELTARRTAAASALAARFLARPDSATHLVIGGGRVGQNIPLAYREVLPVIRTMVFDIVPENAHRAAENLRAQGVAAEAVADAQAAVQAADIITCATLARVPVLKGDWLKAGQHVDLIGSFTPEMREADDEVMRRARVFIDTEDAIVESGDIVSPLKDGAISRDDILGTLKGLCTDAKVPTRAAQDITLFKGVGTAIEDLSGAELAWWLS